MICQFLTCNIKYFQVEQFNLEVVLRMAEEYATVSTFENTIRRIENAVAELRHDYTLFKEEIRAQNAEFRENVTRDLSDMKNNMSKLEGRVSSIDTKLNMLFTFFAIIGVLVTVAQWLK